MSTGRQVASLASRAMTASSTMNPASHAASHGLKSHDRDAGKVRIDIAIPPATSEADFIFQARQSLVSDPPEINLNGTVAYSQGGSLSVPARPGVYLIHDLRGVLYIGRTTNLHQRYFQHYWGSHNKQVTAVLRRPVGRLEFSWIASDIDEQVELERDLIRKIQPLCNRLLYQTV